MGLRRLRGMTLTIALVGLTSIGLVGCSIGEDRSTDLTAARNFPGYLFYYAGPEVEGESLSDVVVEPFDGAAPRWSSSTATAPRAVAKVAAGCL
jgi:hypothetical protein